MNKQERRFLELQLPFGDRAQRLLVEFANTRPESQAFIRFKKRFEDEYLKWKGDEADFRSSQQILRDIWSGKRKGIEGFQVGMFLGFQGDEGSPAPIAVDWRNSSLLLAPRSLNDLVWLALLQNSNRLGVCEKHAKGASCGSPYFLKYRPTARFCSGPCAADAQRASKRRWWQEHGQQWLQNKGGKKLLTPSNKRR